MPATLLTAPAEEPLTLAEAKAFLRLDHDDDDTLVAALIASARLHVEALTRRALVTQTWRVTRDAWPANGRLALLPAPVRNIVSVTVAAAGGAVQAVPAESFDADFAAAPAVLAFAPGSLPAPGMRKAGIAVTFEAGYGAAADVPAPLRQAVRLIAAHYYENRGALPGNGAAPLPASLAPLVAPYRVLAL